MRNLLDNLIKLATPARVAAAVAYVVSVAYPHVSPNMRAAIVGAVSGVYVLGVALVEHAERRWGPVSSSRPAAVPRATSTKNETKVIR